MTIASLNQKIKSQRSIHFIAGYDYRFRMANQRFKFSAEAYYKALSNLVPYSVNNVKVTYYGNNEASGHAAGLDLKLYGEFVPGTDSWISLSIMNTKMKLGGKSIPLPTDQRYAMNLFFTDYFPEVTDGACHSSWPSPTDCLSRLLTANWRPTPSGPPHTEEQTSV